jgi:hypothetical protein
LAENIFALLVAAPLAYALTAAIVWIDGGLVSQ